MIKRTCLILLTVLSFSFSLIAQRNLNKENIGPSYRPDDTSVHPSFKVYHDKDSSSIVLYEVNLNELSYKVNNDSTHFKAQARIHYELYMNYKAKLLIDSGSVYLEDTENYGKNNSSLGYFPVKSKIGYSYVIKVVLTDLNNNSESISLIDISKNNQLGRQNFFLEASDGLPMIVDYVNRNEVYRIIHRDSNLTYAWVKYFEPHLKAAQPPFSGGMPTKRTVKSDSTYKIYFQNGVSQNLEFSKQGYYHIFLDSTKQEGFTVYQLTTNYPYVNAPMQMVMPLRYITSKTEFKTLLENENKKKAVDEFWISMAGNKERARRLIGIYYNRVQQANMLFYSDREGWMTDRGMIFIVFGPPDMVYRGDNMETWLYGYQKNNKSLTFDFYKTENPFTNKDLLLNRSPIYSTPWNNSMEVWRR